MRRILQFIQRNQYILVFVILLVISLRMYAGSNIFFSQQLDKWSLTTNAFLTKQSNRVVTYFALEEENLRVERNNAALLNQNPISFVALSNNLARINDSLYLKRYDFLNSEVVGIEINNKSNFMLIQGGTSNGYYRGMGVVTSAGIVGFIDECATNYSRVKTVLSRDFNVPVYLKSNGYFGYLQWQDRNPNEINLIGVSRDVNVDLGDSVLTLGYTSSFPKGYMVGRVIAKQALPSEAQQMITVKLSEDLRHVQQVLVIHDKMINQIKELSQEDESVR